MRKRFARTSNVERFVAAVNSIQKTSLGVDRMALIYGDPGLGKSETALWWLNHYGQGGALIRTKKIQSARWLLEELVAQLGEDPSFKTSALFNQAVKILAGTNRTVLLDEVDYLAHDSRVIETLRDLADITNAPFVFIGMEHADIKLKRFRHLWRRFSQVVRFEPLTAEDVAKVLAEICEVPVDESAVKAICATGEVTVALVYRWAHQCERLARTRKLETVTAKDLAEGK